MVEEGDLAILDADDVLVGDGHPMREELQRPLEHLGHGDVQGDVLLAQHGGKKEADDADDLVHACVGELLVIEQVQKISLDLSAPSRSGERR